MINIPLKYFPISLTLFFITLLYGCATISGAGSVQFENDFEEVKEASMQALQDMGMEVRDVREDLTSNVIIVGEMEQMGAQTEDGEPGAVDLVRLEVELRELDDGTVSVSALAPTAANYTSTTGQDLSSQFFSSLEQQNLSQIEED